MERGRWSRGPASHTRIFPDRVTPRAFDPSLNGRIRVTVKAGPPGLVHFPGLGHFPFLGPGPGPEYDPGPEYGLGPEMSRSGPAFAGTRRINMKN